jgi:5-formyltetrahydrofolate cyclo-ligase
MEVSDAKGLMRRAAYDLRSAQPDKDQISQLAIALLMQLPEYEAAKTILWYVDCRSELRTKHALPAALASGKRIVVPYCTTDEAGANKLGLWWLQDMNELAVGKWNILEPPRERWGESGKEIRPDEIELVVVPGVGFSRSGGRMGNGQGYYDRLLERPRRSVMEGRSRTPLPAPQCAAAADGNSGDRFVRRQLHDAGAVQPGGPWVRALFP